MCGALLRISYEQGSVSGSISSLASPRLSTAACLCGALLRVFNKQGRGYRPLARTAVGFNAVLSDFVSFGSRGVVIALSRAQPLASMRRSALRSEAGAWLSPSRAHNRWLQCGALCFCIVWKQGLGYRPLARTAVSGLLCSALPCVLRPLGSD